MLIPKGIPARGKRGRSENGIAVLSDGSIRVSQWIQQSHMVQKKTMKQQKLYMFIQELIFIHCDKIIDSNGTEHFSYFFSVRSSLTPSSAFLYSANLFCFGFLAQHFETKERQADCAVMISLYGTGCRTYSSIKMQRQTNGNIIKIYYVLQPLRWRSQDRRRRRWYPCCWRYWRRIESSVTERNGKLKSFENIRVEL